MDLSLEELAENLDDFEIEENNWPNWLLLNTGVYLEDEGDPVILKIATGEDLPYFIISLYSPLFPNYEEEDRTCDIVELEETILDIIDIIYSKTAC
jgi:hypothetical protein